MLWQYEICRNRTVDSSTGLPWLGDGMIWKIDGKTVSIRAEEKAAARLPLQGLYPPNVFVEVAE